MAGILDPVWPAPSQTLPEDVYLLFAGYIDHVAVQRIFEATAAATQGSAKRIHLLMQTTGGTVADGVCLYHYFKTFPNDLIAYNVGTVSSAGVIAYLGAKTRKVASLATFMVHRSTATFQGANVDAIQARIPSLIMDDERTEVILRSHVKFSEEQWKTHAASDLWVTAADAVKLGLATEIGEFAPPPGTCVFNVLG